MNRSRVLADLVPSPGWDAVPAGAVLAPVARTGYPNERLLSVSKYRGVHVREDGDSHSRPSEDLSHYLLTIPGDLVVNIMLAWDRGLGVSTERGLVSPAYATYTVDERRADSRFLDYQVRSEPAIAEWRRRSYGIQPSRWRLYWERMSSAKLLLPDLDTQRRIADMLDAETARIDTLIEKNERVLELLEHRWQSLLENVIFGNPAVRRSPLWLACDITPGYAFRSDAFQQAGPVRLLRGVNVGVGSIDWSDVVYADEPTVAPAAEYRLKAGDLVVGMDRPWISSGLRVARIGPEDEPAYLVQRVARLRPRCGLDQDYLYLALQSRQFYAAFEPVMTGVSVPHVSGGQIGAFRIPMPDVEAQRGLEAELNASWKQAARMRAAVDRQQALLRLRRQALVTAAVTGQVEV